MAYKIRYGHDIKQEIQYKKHRFKIVFTTLPVVCLMLAGFLWPEMRDILREILFPWLKEPAISAFSGMIQEISEGKTVAAALTDFCRAVIRYAGNAV